MLEQDPPADPKQIFSSNPVKLLTTAEHQYARVFRFVVDVLDVRQEVLGVNFSKPHLAEQPNQFVAACLLRSILVTVFQFYRRKVHLKIKPLYCVMKKLRKNIKRGVAAIVAIDNHVIDNYKL